MKGDISVNPKEDVTKARFHEDGDGDRYAKLVVTDELLRDEKALNSILDELVERASDTGVNVAAGRKMNAEGGD